MTDPETPAEKSTRRQRADAIAYFCAKGKPNAIFDEVDYTVFPKLAILFGSESQGISDLAVDHAEICVSVPMHGMIESLNLGTTSSIIFYEMTKQRRRCQSLYRRKGKRMPHHRRDPGMKPIVLALALFGTPAIAETRMAPCHIGSSKHALILSVPMKIEAVPEVLRADHVVAQWRPGEIAGLGLRLPYDRFARIESIQATAADWHFSDGVRVGLSRADYLTLRPDAILTEEDSHPIAWTSGRAVPDDPGSTCIETVRFDPNGRIVEIRLGWAPMTISPATAPTRVPERRLTSKP
ncbi:MAG: TrmH family RNA methyltransferase [Pseudomonadota bacterium]